MARYTTTDVLSQLQDPEIQSKIFYIMLSVAYVDGALADDELAVMVGKLSLFNNFEVEYKPEVLVQATTDFLADNPTERQLKVICYAPEICRNEELKIALMADLESIIDADGKICQAELTAYRHIQQALV